MLKSRKILTGTATVFLLVSLCVVAVGATASDDVLSTLATQIAERRSKVETLSSRLELTKAEYNEQLRSLATQQADIETQMKREELRLEQVERDIADFQVLLQDNRASMEEIEPVLLDVLQKMRVYVETGLPFQVPERLAEIDNLIRIIEEDRVDSTGLMARVWNMMEAEFRLTSESGIYRQTIVVGGEEQLVEVARLGMVLMYFRTFDDRYGYAVPVDDGWEFHYARGRDAQNQISDLFESLRKNLREGYFEVPNPMAL